MRNVLISFFPFIPKITIETDGFILNDKKILIDEVVSVFYRNKYSPNNTIHPLVGASVYEILTKSGAFFFYGEHTDLADFFDNHLEKEGQFEDKYLGLVRRWKQPGAIYNPVSYRDTLSSKISEPIAPYVI